jgi:exopolyphosphatase/guanosine-5'-triphosphate,3'-diphosphate pyrophosphatase
VLHVLREYIRQIADHGCEASTAVMTSAVRDAGNGPDFAGRVRSLGLDARILSGDEEARLTFLGATATRDPQGLAVADIGGGSTEIVMADFHTSMQLGVIRQGERHIHNDPPTPEELAALKKDTRAILTAASLPSPRALVAVAGTPTSAAAIDLQLAEYASTKVEGHRLDRQKLEEMLTRLAAVPLAERRQTVGLHPDRAPTIVAGLIILVEILDCLGLGEVAVSDRDILWGAARSVA